MADKKLASTDLFIVSENDSTELSTPSAWPAPSDNSSIGTVCAPRCSARWSRPVFALAALRRPFSAAALRLRCRSVSASAVGIGERQICASSPLNLLALWSAAVVGVAGCGAGDSVAPCGDGTCDISESCATCSVDCGSCLQICGDGSCRNSESCLTCSADCGACPVSCGDGSCNNGETCSTCSADCGQCPPRCGDSTCNKGENCLICPADCGYCPPDCGNNTCNKGETCLTCPIDCGECPPLCGDATCNGTENARSCAVDCPAVAGDGFCTHSETCSTQPADCPCSPCSGSEIFCEDFEHDLTGWSFADGNFALATTLDKTAVAGITALVSDDSRSKAESPAAASATDASLTASFDYWSDDDLDVDSYMTKLTIAVICDSDTLSRFEWKGGATPLEGDETWRTHRAAVGTCAGAVHFKIETRSDPDGVGQIAIDNLILTGLPVCRDTDTSCDGVDDDCDGQVDEDFASFNTSCGVGACVANGLFECVAGAVRNSCVAANPTAADDAVCDGVDSDCDGPVDEDYRPVVTSCGQGACAASGLRECIGGKEQDSCTPGTAAAADDSACNGIDDDCDGQIDEDAQC